MDWPNKNFDDKTLKFNREFTYVRNNNLYIPFMSFSTPFRNSSIWANVTADPILIELASWIILFSSKTWVQQIISGDGKALFRIFDPLS